MSIQQHMNLYLLGKDYLAHQFLGSFLNRNEKGEIISTTFRVYAPNAKEVRLISSFNNYRGENHKMIKISPYGFFEITVSHNLEYAVYKYEIHTFNNEVLYKSDPFGHFSEVRPQNASIVYDIEGYHWNDSEWFKTKKKVYQEPMFIYELHIGSWRKHENEEVNYVKIAKELVQYCLEQGFTHIELMPVYEYPLDDSWGYQGTGFFAPTSRYGSPKDLMYFIDLCHQNGIGVIMDFVLGHINKDAHGLYRFDGSYLYEFDDAFYRENETWGTANLDFNKGISRSFMMSALTFWMDYFHVDGFRIDAVSHLIYHLGNKDNGENKGAINFIKELSNHLFAKDDRIIFSAEDSTDYPKVTWPTDVGGLGFNYKWNMGYMNDTLKYFKEDPIYRKFHHHNITFGLVYAFNEQFILPYSHDEVVHMKGTLVQKMFGSYEQKFSNYKLLMTLMITHPGKKLLFMGQEFAQMSEWNFRTQLDWHLYQYPIHDSFNLYLRNLIKIYKSEKALFQYDHQPKGFRWLIVDHKDSSVFSYARYSDDDMIITVLNMTPNSYESYEVGVPNLGNYDVLIDSNQDIYSGYDLNPNKMYQAVKGERNGEPYHILLKLGPLSAVVLKYKKSR
ncbi:1,4-alpha-glucan branching protein GlgB [Acholeplasma equifetale]|uniref:1,4-alpha-glucan branching protein GlgB n=1 Tax=Acholeplasma equifetale TaxID=264634 RepID=UPI000AF1F12A|nr:1,4-alpha-glucan branching protein GlgB [Acholeplasma equifetale]